MADGEQGLGQGPIPVRVADPERGTPRQPSWRPRQERGRLGGLLLLRTLGRSHYVELGKRSGAARRARPRVQPVCRVEARLTPEELGLLQRVTRRLGVAQGTLIRSCLMAGLAALAESEE